MNKLIVVGKCNKTNYLISECITGRFLTDNACISIEQITNINIILPYRKIVVLGRLRGMPKNYISYNIVGMKMEKYIEKLHQL